jgi:tripartite-type tricarboxylate transporter receptor subunit TctC
MKATLMKNIALTLILSLVPVLCLSQAGNSAANYPNKPIKIIVPFTAGSGADTSSRFYGDLLSKLWGQPVLVENKPGGSGIVAVQSVKTAAADGYTILMATNSPMTVNPIVMKNLPYDSIKDFRPVIGVSIAPVAFIVRTDSPYKTMKDLVEATKKSGVSLNMGNYSAGYELIGAWLGTAASLQINAVPYKGGEPMMVDIMGGQLTTGAIDFAGAAPRIKDGRLRALAITGNVRDPAFPDIPTMKESGYTDFESYVWASFFVRTETPDDITTKLYEGFKKVMASPEARTYQAGQPAKLMDLGPQDLKAFVIAEIERFRRVAQAAGIQAK